jgi:dienelactone hydrolase
LLIWLALLAGCQTVTIEESKQAGATLGPEQAAGLVIWMHGKSSYRDPSRRIPKFVGAFEAAGYDVVRLQRPRAVDRTNRNADLLISTLRDYRARGYRKVVFVGQSCGAWASLKAATLSGEMDAVIATAPACHGTRRSRRFVDNSTELFQFLGAAQPTRIMLFFFEDDDYDPGGRGFQAERILRERDVIFEIFDRPAGFVGHRAAYSTRFAQAFGERMVAFVDREKINFRVHDLAIRWAGKPATNDARATIVGDDGFTVVGAWDDETCAGSFEGEGSAAGTWSLVCSGGQQASRERAEGGVRLVGQDLDGNDVELRFSESYENVNGLRFVNWGG